MSDKRPTSATLFDDRAPPTSTESTAPRADSAAPASQAASVDAGGRRKGCHAVMIAGYEMCWRCGSAWPAGAPRERCRPIDYTRMYFAVMDEAQLRQDSHEAIVALMRNGLPGDPVPALARSAELRAAARVLQIVMESPEIKEAIKAKAGKGL